MEDLHVKPQRQFFSTSKFLWTSLCAILIAFVLLLTILHLSKYEIFPFGADSNESDQLPIIDSADVAEDNGISGQGPNLSALTSELDTDDGPWLAAGHENYQFTISGVVPNEETKQKISRSVNVIFARYNTLAIEIDPDVGSTAWTDNPEDGIIPMLRALAFRTIEAQFVVNKDVFRFKGTAPNVTLDGLAYADAPKQVVANATTLPSFEQEITIVEEVSKTIELKAAYDGDSIVFSGAVPQRELFEEIAADSRLVLGGVEVVDAVAIDQQVFAPFPAINFHQYIQAFALSREFDIGVQNGQFTGSIVYGIQFEENSSELPEQVKSSLKNFVVLLRRAPFPVEIIGHTDSVGSAEANSALSKARAEAVRQYLLDEGDLSPQRSENITATGKGAEEPVGSNDTAEGRNLNRRVELSVADGKPI